MISLDNTLIDSVLKDSCNKSILCHEDKDMLKQLSFSTNNFFTYFATNCSKFEVAQIINSNDKYLQVKNSHFRRINYKKKQILIVELGVNFNSLSYKHPCIVIADLGDKLFVVPCTSGSAPRDKNNNIYKGYLEGDSNDGFNHLTTIICKECLCIDKSQVITAIRRRGNYREISNDMFNKINDMLFESLLNGIYYKMNRMEEQVGNLIEEKEKLEEEKIKLQEDKSHLEEEINKLKEEINKIKNDNKTEKDSIELVKEIALDEKKTKV